MPSLATLDVRHHTFLQALMSKGPLSEEVTHGMFKSLLKVNTLDGFNSFLGDLNKELEFVDMEVKKATNQNDGNEYFGMINKLPSPQAKLGTRYTTAQIFYFKAVMEAIVLGSSGKGYIDSSEALYLKPSEALQVDPTQAGGSQVGVPVKMTLSSKGEALGLLVKDQWLSRPQEGGFSLGTRAFLELRGLFRNLEVPFCEVCNEAAIKAELCRNDECPVRMHSYCVAKKFRARQARACSRCQTGWTSVKGENVDDNQEIEIERPLPNMGNTSHLTTVLEPQETEVRRSHLSQMSQRSTRRKAAMNSETDNEEEESENAQEITRLDSEEEREESLQPRRRRLRKRH